MLRIAVCDDKEHYALQMKYYLHEVEKEMERPFYIRLFHSTEEFMFDIDEGNYYELMLIDCMIKDTDGVEFAARIKKRNPTTLIIFMAENHDHVYRSFEASPSGFLRKPYNEIEVLSTLRRVLAECDAMPAFVYKERNKTKKFYYKDILYFCSEGRHVHIETVNGSEIINDKLDNLENKIQKDSNLFWRIHKSALVNKNYITDIRYTELTISDGSRKQIFSISQKYRSDIREKITEQQE